ncbi:MAG TPA: response regulator, partial [Planctomycetota bacterium]|nr:response regulator [Planctomycetota bacterium]
MMIQERAKKVTGKQPPRAPTVMIVDDQPEILVSLRRVFRDERYELVTFSSPMEALEWMRTHPVDLVIADERMPDMRGSDLLEKIRENSPRTIRVILTGYPGSATVGYGLAHGIDWLISKPWNDDALRITLRQLLEDGVNRPPASAAPESSFEEPDLAEFCERVPVALHCLGPDGVVRWVNRAELDLLGYSRDELVGRPVARIHADPASIREVLERLERREAVRHCPVRLLRKDGRTLDALLDADPHWSGGRLEYARCVTRPVEEPVGKSVPHRSE